MFSIQKEKFMLPKTIPITYSHFINTIKISFYLDIKHPLNPFVLTTLVTYHPIPSP